ncbi:MFS transporter [Kushneria phosphatilytica]|uniref:MHS family MFS transporter n=1 Tax=Kushneria phosphatilytica TaxID=657387 RepID=A0A1S1NX93_9GAMM|nr:MFS transporter [Kushneria phosphatilytica]OHV12180.1 MFS transporter [Kushneria phosphatilytica]QEL11372.1 MHS family MFS transporter [Kushneria phosphatilytica]
METFKGADHGTQGASRPLNGRDIRILGLSALGGALEFYDFVIFVYFATVVGQLFFPSEMPDWLRLVQTFGIFAAGYLARPLGGIIMAHFGDLLGRKKMFMLSIFLMAVPTLVMGSLPTYETIGVAAPILLLLMRVLQGAAIGGEAPGAWVFVTEHVPARHTAFATSTLSAGLVGGILLGSLVATAVNALFTDATISAWAWRLPFLLGGVLGFVTLYLRRWLHETPVFTEMQQRQSLSTELPVKLILRDHLRGVMLAMGVTWLLTAAVVVTILMTPTLLQNFAGVDRGLTLEANIVAIICVMIGCLVAGRLADRFGDGLMLLIWSVGLGVSFWYFFSHMYVSTVAIFPLYAVVGFFVGLTGLVPAIAVKAFPAAIRFTGLSFSYNVAYAIFGGLTPMVVTLSIKSMPMSPAIYVAFVCTVGALIGLGLMRVHYRYRRVTAAAS